MKKTILLGGIALLIGGLFVHQYVPEHSVARAQVEPKKLLILGDSWCIFPYEQYVASLPDWEVVENCSGGNSIWRLLNGGVDEGAHWDNYKVIALEQPDVILVQIGFVDSISLAHQIGRWEGLTSENIWGYAQYLIENSWRKAAPDARIIWSGYTNPADIDLLIGKTPVSFFDTQEKLEYYNRFWSIGGTALAQKGVELIRHEGLFQDEIGIMSSDPNYWADPLHLTPSSYQVIVDRVIELGNIR